jgi:hypothetical protein
MTFFDLAILLSRAPLTSTLSIMSSPFLNLPEAGIVSRIETIASAAAGEPVVVRVGEEVLGWRNVGVDLPRRRRSAAEGRLLRERVLAALEGAGVVRTATAGAPKVDGQLLGHVRVREVAPSWGDASGFARGPTQR